MIEPKRISKRTSQEKKNCSSFKSVKIKEKDKNESKKEEVQSTERNREINGAVFAFAFFVGWDLMNL